MFSQNTLFVGLLWTELQSLVEWPKLNRIRSSEIVETIGKKKSGKLDWYIYNKCPSSSSKRTGGETDQSELCGYADSDREFHHDNVMLNANLNGCCGRLYAKQRDITANIS